MNETAEDALILVAALNGMGYYPAMVNQTPRSEWQEGYNAYGAELLEMWTKLSKFSSGEPVVHFVTLKDKTLEVWVTITDRDGWGSDATPVDPSDLPEIAWMWENFSWGRHRRMGYPQIQLQST